MVHINFLHFFMEHVFFRRIFILSFPHGAGKSCRNWQRTWNLNESEEIILKICFAAFL